MIARCALILFFLAVAAASAGCTTTPRQWWESLKGNGFPGWSDNLASGARSNQDAKPSGFFTDRRSEEIEKSLGGNF